VSENVPLNSEAGKQQVEALLAKMTPEQQVEFKAALASDKPVHVHVDKEGKIALGAAADAAAPSTVEAAPENVTELKREEPKKPSKLDQKRQQIFMDRLKRKMGEKTKDGTPKTQEQALQEMQREDYNAWPVEKKFERLESLVAQSFRNLSQEIMHLSQEHMAIGDAFDINYRAIQKMFIKLGLTNEEQKTFLDEAQNEVLAIRKKQQADMEQAQMQRQARQQGVTEQQTVEAELTKPQAKVVAEGAAPAEEGAAPPAEATVFGG
jgi:hypothetical protein